MVEVDEARARRQLAHRYIDEVSEDLEDALRRVEHYTAAGEARSIGLIGNAAAVYPDLLARGILPDLRHRPDLGPRLPGLLPRRPELRGRPRPARPRPGGVRKGCPADSMARQCAAMLEFQRRGSIVFDYGNNLRQRAYDAGVSDAFNYPGFVPAYIRPLFCEGKGPFRWVALSGDPEDIRVTDEAVLELFPDDDHLQRWIRMAQEQVQFQGLPARICWLGYGERHRAGLRFNELVASGAVKAPIVIGRDHLDAGSVASPNRETEGMRDGSDAIADWPILNALINTAAGADLGQRPPRRRGRHRLQPARRAGDRGRRHAAAAARLERVLTTDPGMGVVRHVDAGYELAVEVARERGVKIPMMK